MGPIYHASPVRDIAVLEPRISNHGVPQIYFSRKRENVLVYLCNAVERYCRETGFAYTGPWQKWGPYGFDRDGRMRLEEYYPNALAETYRGIPAYIYAVEETPAMESLPGIRDAVTSSECVPVVSCEFIPDAYEAIVAAAQAGLLRVVSYADRSPGMDAWLRQTIPAEYKAAVSHPEYRHFLKGKFPALLSDCE